MALKFEEEEQQEEFSASIAVAPRAAPGKSRDGIAEQSATGTSTSLILAGGAVSAIAALFTIEALRRFSPFNQEYVFVASFLCGAGTLLALLTADRLQNRKSAVFLCLLSFVAAISFVVFATGAASQFLVMYALANLAVIKLLVRNRLAYFAGLCAAILALIPVQRSTERTVIQSYGDWEQTVQRESLPVVAADLEGQLFRPGTRITWEKAQAGFGLMDEPAFGEWKPFYGSRQWVVQYRGKLEGSTQTVSAFAAADDHIVLRLENMEPGSPEWKEHLMPRAFAAIKPDLTIFSLPNNRWQFWVRTDRHLYLEPLTSRGIAPGYVVRRAEN